VSSKKLLGLAGLCALATACGGATNALDPNSSDSSGRQKRANAACDGYSSSGVAVVQSVSHYGTAGGSSTAGSVVRFAFTPDSNPGGTTGTVSISMNLTMQCVLDENLRPGTTLYASGWVRKSGDCEASQLTLTSNACR